MTKRVLVGDSLSPEGLALFEKAGYQVDVKLNLSASELAAIIGDYDALVARSKPKVPAEVFANPGKLKVVGRAGIGVDNIDGKAARAKEIAVMNTPGGNTVTTAEHAIALMFSLARHIPRGTASLKAGRWEKNKLEGIELFNKTLGVVGLGQVGKIVADRALGLKMKVIGFDPYVSEADMAKLGVEAVDLDALLARADVITIHTPKTAATTNLIDSAAFEKMKPGALLINAARGGIVDETALAAALESGRLGGAALDVFVNEPPGDHPLLRFENLIATPHLGASTFDAQVNVAIQVAEQIIEFLDHGVARNVVN
ncbi:MAG: D-glycerate dehydrogenase [Myxococcales bacterium]|nr:D-glycerate dehydrogenase [Myxococcales bacterium]